MRPTRLYVVVAIATIGLALTASAKAPEPTPALFENVTSAVGLDDVRSARVAFADLDGDGYPDAVIDGTRIYRNVAAAGGARRFVRAEHDPDKAGAKRVSVVQIGDVNDDGHPDLFLGRSIELGNPKVVDDGRRSEIWLAGKDASYAPVDSSGVGAVAETTVSACFVDYDRDGILDLFVANQYVVYGQSLEAFPNRLFHGRGDGTFEDVTARAGMLGIAEPGHADSRRPTYGCTHTDWNNDGLQDLLCMTYGRQANRLWRNNGDGTFTDVAVVTSFDGDDIRDGKYPEESKKLIKGLEDELPFRSHGNTFDGAVADYDGDGNMDVFLAAITHWWAGPSSDLSMLLVNEGPEHGFHFRRRPELIERHHESAHWNQGDLHAGWLDVDNDGLLDLLIASSDYPDEQILKLYHQKPDHTFEDWTDRLGVKWVNASQISLGDFDGDGATDILIGTNNMRLTADQVKAHSLNVGLLRNKCAAAAGNGFLTLRLVGGGRGMANRDAIGARVTLWIGDKRQTREVQGGLGHAGHRDDTDCRFGVGKAKTVDKIEVRWPDAAQTVQVFKDVPTSKFYVLNQGGALREGRSPRSWY